MTSDANLHTYPETLQTDVLPERERNSDWQRQNIVGDDVEKSTEVLTA